MKFVFFQNNGKECMAGVGQATSHIFMEGKKNVVNGTEVHLLLIGILLLNSVRSTNFSNTTSVLFRCIEHNGLLMW